MKSLLLAAIIVILFAATNPHVVAVQFFSWQIDSPLVLIVVVAFALGFIVGALQLVPGYWRHRTTAKKSSETLTSLEKERDSLQEQLMALENKIREPSLKDNSSHTQQQ